MWVCVDSRWENDISCVCLDKEAVAGYKDTERDRMMSFFVALPAQLCVVLPEMKHHMKNLNIDLSITGAVKLLYHGHL